MVFIVSFAVCLADASNGVATRNNIGSFVASRCRQSKVDNRVHEARVTVGEQGRFGLVNQHSRIPSDCYCNQLVIDSKGDRKQSR
jgi:hypothetical protein